jgi:Uncharacterized conserved protein (some members contain a von Willebrand factor type A (vWA) domain)
MTSSILTKVRVKMSIEAKKRATNTLDGNYKSIFKGRSMDFEDLREYVVGDDVKDIDWKATARSGQTLIRRYVAEKKHNILIITDVGERMMAITPDNEVKGELAVYSAGVLAYLATKHGDFINLMTGNSQSLKSYPFKQGINHAERLLHDYNKLLKDNKIDGNVGEILEFICRKIKRRMIIFVITDSNGVSKIDDSILKKISVVNDQMFIILKDSQITNIDNEETLDIDANKYIPKYIRENKELMIAEEIHKQELYNDIQNKLKKKGISNVLISNEKEVINQILKLLEGHKNG